MSLLELAGPVASIWCISFVTHLLRYLFICGPLDTLVRGLPALQRRRLQKRVASTAQRRVELRSSLEAGAIFALQFVPFTYAVAAGWTRMYFDPTERGTAYLVASFFVALAVHDTYFYWTHRWMHLPRVFRIVHAHHHGSRTPTTWAAFSFHWMESLVQGGIHLLLPLLIPLHVSVLGAFVLFATVHSAVIHCGHDVFGARDQTGARTRLHWINTSVDHDAHHDGVRGNYALYFSWWDRVMGTWVPSSRY